MVADHGCAWAVTGARYLCVRREPERRSEVLQAETACSATNPFPITLQGTMSVPPPRLNLVVLRSSDMDRASAFYRALGLEFTKHAHGSGPEHYSAEIDGLVFEIYPKREGQSDTSAARSGFSVDSIDELVPLALAAGGKCISSPRDSPWGRRAVVRDIDGHSVELVTRVPPPGERVNEAPKEG